MNVLYFEGASMHGLYEALSTWERTDYTGMTRPLKSISIQQDGDKFCCIALMDELVQPVVICSGAKEGQARVDGHLLCIANSLF